MPGLVAGGWAALRASMSIQQHGARQSCTLWVAQGTHAHWDNLSNIGIVGYWINGVVASAGLILRSCPTIPSGGWARWLVLGAQCAGLRAECGSEGEIQPGLGWAGLGWAGQGGELVLVFISTAARFLDSTSTACLHHQPPLEAVLS